jgi:hypothetical protein
MPRGEHHNDIAELCKRLSWSHELAHPHRSVPPLHAPVRWRSAIRKPRREASVLSCQIRHYSVERAWR